MTYEKLKGGGGLTKETIQTIIIDAPVAPPIYIDLRPGALRGNGHQGRPLNSIDDAEDVLERARRCGVFKDTFEERPHAYVACHANHDSCDLLSCVFPGCGKMICRTHGDGIGFYREDPGGYRLYFPEGSCMVQGCRATHCSSHINDEDGWSRFARCDVCHNAPTAEMALVADPYIAPEFLSVRSSCGSM